MKKIINFLALVLGFSVVALADQQAVICEIRPCNDTYQVISAPVSSIENPMVPGEKVRFLLRLHRPDWQSSQDDFALCHYGTNSRLIDDFYQPLAIGIIVSGEPRKAVYVGDQSVGAIYHDFIFEYTLEPSDFALPVRLMLNDFTPAGYGARPSQEYYFYNRYNHDATNPSGCWDIVRVTKDGDPIEGINLQAGLCFHNTPDLPSAPNGERVMDYALNKAGFYVKSIRFDDMQEDETSNIWRRVHQGSSITGFLVPKIVMDTEIAPIDQKKAISLYVWSEDDSIIKVKNGTPTEICTNYSSGVECKATCNIGKVTIEAGKVTADFTLEAPADAEVGKKTKLYLSAFTNFTFDATNTRAVDYLTVDVEVSEPLPPTLVVDIDPVKTFANSSRYTAAAQLSVYISQPIEHAAKVLLKPSFANTTAPGDLSWTNYFRLGTVANSVSALPDNAEEGLEIEIPANSTEKKSVYLFALRSDDFTKDIGNQIFLTPEFTGDTEAQCESCVSNYQKAGFWIYAEKPIINDPVSNSSVEAIQAEPMYLEIKVSDTYADEADQDIGYTIECKQKDGMTWEPLPGKYIIKNGLLKNKDDDSLPSITYTFEGAQTTRIRITSPISKMTSLETVLNATVAKARTSTIETTDLIEGEARTQYDEGDTVNFKITLSEKNTTGSPIYAFLVPNLDAKKEMFEPTAGRKFILDPEKLNEAQADAKGISIANMTGDEANPAKGAFRVLDGGNPETYYYFSVVFCSTSTYAPTQKISGYGSNEMIISVKNVVPRVEDVYFNDANMNSYDDHIYPYSIPRGQVQTIQPVIDDVSYDMYNTAEGSDDHSKNIRYKITANTTGYKGKTEIVTNDISEAGVVKAWQYNFPRKGEWTIKIEPADKDMSANNFGEPYTFKINVLDNPSVNITTDTPDDTYYESDTRAKLRVGLDFFDADDYIAVKLKVTPPTGENAGSFKLDDAYKTTRNATHYPLTELGEDEYYVFFEGPDTEEILITSMDGTRLSEATGIIISADVLGDQSGPNGKYNEVEDPESPGDKITWAKYYTRTSKNIKVINEKPVVVMTEVNDVSNRWEVAGGLASAFPIRMTLRSDVKADLEGIENFSGIKFTIIGVSGGRLSPELPEPNKPTLFYATEPNTYEFIPDFGAVQGDQIVNVSIEDKDGGFETYTYYYHVTPSKFLDITASGPAGGMSSAMSRSYASAAGTGQGHVFTTGFGNPAKVENFTATWNCSSEYQASAYAIGYKVGAVDNGKIQYGEFKELETFGLTPSGYLADASTTEFYTYPDPTLDSYLYTWLLHLREENGVINTGRLGDSITPEIPGRANAQAIFSLPPKMTEDGGYIRTLAEAVFAKEWRASDNLGDINGDAIPDVFVAQYGFGIIDPLTRKVTGNDLQNLSNYNEDEDFLPSPGQGGAGFTPNTDGGWPTSGGAFTAKLEIRGFGDALNRGYSNPDGTKPNPDYTVHEKCAYILWKSQNGGIPAEDPDDEAILADDLTVEQIKELPDADFDALWAKVLPSAKADLEIANSGIENANNGEAANGWSPERPSDPTVADTDGDGIKDGVEYWFWYAAKVGYSENGTRAQWYGPLHGRRIEFDKGIDKFQPIYPATLLAAFDPIVASTITISGRDTDNDGLFDIEEFLIGTNPVDCDTDGGGVPDGYEVMWGLNPCNSSDDNGNLDNPDRDYMAYSELEDQHIAYITTTEDGVTTHYRYLVKDFTEVNRINQNAGRIVKPFVKALLLASEVEPPPVVADDPPVVADDDEGEPGEWPNDGIDAATYTMQLGTDTILFLESNPTLSLVELKYEDLLPTGVLGPRGEIGFVLIHDQVKNFFGFDPRTAWTMGSAYDDGVIPRWKDPSAHDAGRVMNTRRYRTIDEYCYGEYRRSVLKNWNPTGTFFNQIHNNCTNPNVIVEGKTYGDSPTQYASTIHGADTNGDGVADGWTIYNGGNPINANPPKWGGAHDDDDGLVNADEFIGTDVLIAYQDCPTIAARAENWRWLNKFFPTDPAADDTDGDGVNDFEEGAAWQSTFFAGRQTWDKVNFNFVYGEEPNDTSSRLFRGGGMNPCSTDTDLDGLPDAWERQFAGVVIDANGTPLLQNPSGVYTEQMQIADGFKPGAVAALKAFITGGMDATNPLDAGTALDVSFELDNLTGEHITKTSGSVDPNTLTVRDFDFDHDGLENFQEYLTQSVRAWRYDDAETPLMGRSILWKYETAEVEEGEVPAEPTLTIKLSAIPTVAQLSAYKKMNVVSGNAMWHALMFEDNPAANAYGKASIEPATPTTPAKPKYEANEANDYSKYLVEQYGFDYAALGYFAPTEHEWDVARQCSYDSLSYNGINGYRYMRMPSAMIGILSASVPTPRRIQARSYVSTDPRRWDSDNDGMDDYWEIFHGLNPLLGAPSDIVSNAYGSQINNKNNMWVGLPDGAYAQGEEDPLTGGAIPGQDFAYAQVAAADANDTDITDRGEDPFMYPWRTGQPMNDLDGDGLRNIDEALMANMTSPAQYHTDPSPLWMTDNQNVGSFVSQYYNLIMEPGRDDEFPTQGLASFVANYPWGWATSVTDISSSPTTMFAFDRTEGYDTDSDWIGDGFEVVKGVMPSSDPLDAFDPARRSALYFDGNNSAATSYLESTMPTFDKYDLFRQFTVEAWVKPEDVSKAQTIVERGFDYPETNLENPNRQWRANFRLAITAGGILYGCFDNDNAIASDTGIYSSQRVEAGAIEAGKWTHVALTFDGSYLVIYVNGVERKRAQTNLIPANGVFTILQEPQTQGGVPALAYTTYTGANTLGARRVKGDFSWATHDGVEPWAAFADFFTGYIAEVRFWDGARTSAEIQNAYQAIFSKEDLLKNRDSVYKAWADGATRNDNDGEETLEAQLITLYNFQQLPAAVDGTNVAKTPTGFDHVFNNASVPEAIRNISWWKTSPYISTVYTDTRIVPWVPNMVSRLPLMDGSFADSQFWGSYYAASYVSAQNYNNSTFAIPNGGNPYKGRATLFDTDLHYARLIRLAEMNDAGLVDDTMGSSVASSAAKTIREHADRYRFQLRNEFLGNDDLIVIGGAFAKIDSDYWDKQGASTTWTDTGVDTDADGLPDWWEELYCDSETGIAPEQTITYNGLQMSAWEAYLRDLARGMQPDGNTNSTYVDKADMDADGLPDWWQNIYGVKGGAQGDDDGDGLSNYVEYMLSEIFKTAGDTNIGAFSPINAFSVNPNVSDYFAQIGSSYVGEIFTDHDKMQDLWEAAFKNENIAVELYDADVDADNDGWTNFEEFMAGTDPTTYESHGPDGVTMMECPIPQIKATIVYNGNNTAVSNAALVVEAWHHTDSKKLEGKADAVWQFGRGASAQQSTQQGGDDEEELYPGASAGMKHIGRNPRRNAIHNLSPGAIIAGTVKMEFRDQNWLLLELATRQTYFTDAKYAMWQEFVRDQPVEGSNELGELIDASNNAVIGTVNYKTGEVRIDYSLIDEYGEISGNLAEPSATGNWISIYNLSKSFVRIRWQSKPLTSGNSATYYLSEATTGHVKGGRNLFIAFYDIDGDGKYTAGEPYGVQANVDVGWNSAECAIELTETHPLTARFKISSGDILNDRKAVFGDYNENVPATWFQKPQEFSDGTKERVRIVRTLFNLDTEDKINTKVVVLDKKVDLNNNPYITEADFLISGEFDIDWSNSLSTAADKHVNPITNITYRVVLGDGDIVGFKSDNLLHFGFRRKVDTPSFYTNNVKAMLLNLGNGNDQGIVVTPSPTLKWRIINSQTNLDHWNYTAFKVEIKSDDGEFTWTSDYMPMPGRKLSVDGKLIYEWTPPLIVGGKTPDGTGIFENNKNYKWRIAVANSRFKNSPKWSEEGSFRMNVLENSNAGTAQVAVRYYGPFVPSDDSLIRVQAFSSPDFSGRPVGEGYVTDFDSLKSTNAISSANATITGLPAGTYYLRAFIDQELDGNCAVWESFGYACYRDISAEQLYTPKPITVGPSSGTSDIIEIYIEDCDTDRDGLPDAWEWTKEKGLTDKDTKNLNSEVEGLIPTNSAIVDEITRALDSAPIPGLAVRTHNLLSSPYTQGMILGMNSSLLDNPTNFASVLAQAVEAEVEPRTITFTRIEFNPETGTIEFDIETDADVESNLPPRISSLYSFETRSDLVLTLSMRLWTTDSVGGNWTEITEARQQVNIGIGETETTIPPIDISEYTSLSQGFFKVTLEK